MFVSSLLKLVQKQSEIPLVIAKMPKEAVCGSLVPSYIKICNKGSFVTV